MQKSNGVCVHSTIGDEEKNTTTVRRPVRLPCCRFHMQTQQRRKHHQEGELVSPYFVDLLWRSFLNSLSSLSSLYIHPSFVLLSYTQYPCYCKAVVRKFDECETFFDRPLFDHRSSPPSWGQRHYKSHGLPHCYQFVKSLALIQYSCSRTLRRCAYYSCRVCSVCHS